MDRFKKKIFTDCIDIIEALEHAFKNICEYIFQNNLYIKCISFILNNPNVLIKLN